MDTSTDGGLGERLTAGPTALTTDDAVHLQTTAGNQAVSGLLASQSEGSAKRKPGELDDTAESPKKKGRQRKYGPGRHGDKKHEQQRLKAAFGVAVTGDTHESEHAIGYEPLSQTADLPRGKSTRAKELENYAPAYQEAYERHRGHIGTGTTNEVDASGFNSHTYRDSQRKLVQEGDVSSAVQLNQLGYAFDPAFRGDDEAERIADDSYDVMVDNLHSLMYADGDDDASVDVDAVQRAEMYLARRAARTGVWPTAEEIAAAKKKFGVGA
ncbi:MAG: hypothetical protein KG028_09380 [Actinobacteria bacterium]|nr:hypothetical protein [Actinomycetota bacterium]